MLLFHLLKPASDILYFELFCPLRHQLVDSRPHTTPDSYISIQYSHSDLQKYLNNIYVQVQPRCPIYACEFVQEQKFIEASYII